MLNLVNVLSSCPVPTHPSYLLKKNIAPLVSVLYLILKRPCQGEKSYHLKGKSWIHTQELQDYFGVLLVPCNTHKSHKYLMEKQQKMRSAAAFGDRIYVAEQFFEAQCKGQKQVDRLKLLIFANLRPHLKVSLSILGKFQDKWLCFISWNVTSLFYICYMRHLVI